MVNDKTDKPPIPIHQNNSMFKNKRPMSLDT